MKQKLIAFFVAFLFVGLPFAEAKSFGGGGGKSFGSSSSRSSSSSKSSSSPKSSSSSSSKPKSSFDFGASSAQSKAQSKSNYSSSQKPTVTFSAPKPTYTDPKGRVQTINQSDKRVQQVRTSVTPERLETRTTRVQTFYGPQYSTWHASPPIVYHDPYSSIFSYWLLSQSLDRQAEWLYHHRNDVDQARLNDMYAKNAQLQAKVASMEAQKIAVDPNYVPVGMDPDLQFNDDFVASAANPVVEENNVTVLGVLGTIVVIIVVGFLLMSFIIWMHD